MKHNYDRHQAMLDRFGGERTRPYLVLAGGRRKDALALYKWNVEISAAFLEMLAVVEVVTRNAFYEQLSSWCRQQTHDPDWLTMQHGLPHPLNKLFESTKAGATSLALEAKSKRDQNPNHARTQVPISEGDVLSQVSFGKWHNLIPFDEGEHQDEVTNGYRETIWDEALHKAFFDPTTDSDEVRWLLYRLSYFRNRIAHHECVLLKPLTIPPSHALRERLHDIFRLSSLIDQDIHILLTSYNRVSSLLKSCPIEVES